MPPNILQSVPDKSVLLSTTFMCAHDTFSDSGVQVTPHLVADCMEFSKQIADIIAKHKMQDSTEQPYELIARNAEKTAQKAEKKLAKAKKAFEVAAKKLKAMTDKAAKPDAKAPAKAKKNNALVKAKKTADKTKIAFDKLSKAAAEAWKKAEAVIGIQLDIVEWWKHAIAKMKPAAVCVGEDVAVPTCTESCELYLAQCAKCKGSKCQCA